jgi:hypothetical protein
MNPKSTSILAGTILLTLSMGLLPAVLAAPETTSSGVGTPAGILALIVNDDLFSTADLTTLVPAVAPAPKATQHYGPYASSSPDSGTCGNDWAEDMFDRHFTVFKNQDGTLTVVQQFKRGSFETLAGPSPGSCDLDNPPGGLVDAGKTGSMHGYFIIPIPMTTTQTSDSPYCDAVAMSNADCTTTTFINTHFTPACYPATCPVTTFFFHYAAGDQGLIMHEWKNASEDRGGNSGDIRSTDT